MHCSAAHCWDIRSHGSNRSVDVRWGRVRAGGQQIVEQATDAAFADGESVLEVAAAAGLEYEKVTMTDL